MCIRDRPEDKHTGFLVGTDDYMTKPPDRTELLLRIKALLRRARIVDEHKICLLYTSVAGFTLPHRTSMVDPWRGGLQSAGELRAPVE